MMSEKTYWHHRLENFEPFLSIPLFLEHDLISIGFSDIAVSPEHVVDNGDFNKFCENYRAICDWDPKNDHRISLQRFKLDMKVGDYVAVPISGAYHICEIFGDNCLTPTDLIPSIWSNTSVIMEDRALILPGRKRKIGDENRVDVGFVRRIKKLCEMERNASIADHDLPTTTKIKKEEISKVKAAVEQARKG